MLAYEVGGGGMNAIDRNGETAAPGGGNRPGPKSANVTISDVQYDLRGFDGPLTAVQFSPPRAVGWCAADCMPSPRSPRPQNGTRHRHHGHRARRRLVACRPPTYTPRDPCASVLYTVVREHVETFRVEAARLRDGDGLPRFVDDEFGAFLRCGFLAGGFARFRCGDCRTERLVAFSCKGRGFCPSCGGRRMAERAAHLVDHVLPDVPVRQWVLTLPHRLRYLLAWRPRPVPAVSADPAPGDRAAPARLGARRTACADARGGGVAVIQRFGGSVNLNVRERYLA